MEDVEVVVVVVVVVVVDLAQKVLVEDAEANAEAEANASNAALVELDVAEVAREDAEVDRNSISNRVELEDAKEANAVVKEANAISVHKHYANSVKY